MDEAINIDSKPGNKNELTFRGLVGATFDTVKLFRSHEVNAMGALALVGMKAAFPKRFSNEMLRNDANLDFYNCVIWLGIEINDAVDIIPHSRSSGSKEPIEHIFRTWKRALRVSKGVTEGRPDQEELLTNYQREILFLEKGAREMNDDQAAKEARNYREIMNAISIVHNAGALFGKKELGSRLATIDKPELSWDTLRNKYDWIISGSPQNETEKKLCALYNLVMGVQVIDDYCDIEDDRRLGLRTIATELLKDVKDPTKQKELAEAEALRYFQTAEQMGVSEPAWKGMKQVFSTLKGLQHKFPNQMGGKRERWLNGGRKIIQGN